MELILSSGHNFSEYQCYATKINKGRWAGKDAIFSKILFNFVVQFIAPIAYELHQISFKQNRYPSIHQ
jgi:hypothetical protein